MKKILTIIGLAAATLAGVQAQTSFTSNAATTAWNVGRWNNSADGPTYTSTYTANNAVSFTSGTYNFAGMGATVNVGNITLSSNVTVNFASAANTFATNGSVRTIDVGAGATMNFAGQAISTAVGTGFIKSGNGTMIITSGNTYAGGFTLSAGTMVAGGVNAMGSGGALNLNGGILTVSSATNRDFSAKYAGGISIGGDVQLGDAVNVSAGTGNMTFSNTVALGNATRALTTGANGTYTFSGVISGSLGTGLTVKANSGTSGSIVLSGSNTYTGLTDVQGGTLTLGNSTNTIADTANVTVSGGTLNVANSDTVGAVTLSSGVISGSGNLTGSSYSLTNNGTISAGLAGSGNLTKTGLGNATLSGTNALTGSTLVSSGTLVLTGNGTIGSGNVTVNGGLDISAITASAYTLGSNQTLSGNGTITATGKTLSLAGTLNPGNSPGTLTVNGGFTLTSNATSNFEIGGTTAGLFDKLSSAGGNLTLGGTLNLSTSYSFALNDSVDILDWSTPLSGAFSSVTGTSLSGGYSWDTSALYTTGVITVVPEPKTWVLIGIGTSFMIWNLRRRRRFEG